MKNLLYILTCFGFLFAGCKGQEQLVAATTTQPEWVANRPLNRAYYVGIGSATKKADPINFAQTAKKNAFDDLASEISVVIKSESFLNTMQVNKQVQEQFSSVIATTSNERIEDFEVMDVYETSEDYYIYYRLSKASHEAIKAERKRMTLNAAADQYLKGLEAAENGQVKSALDLMFKGLFEMKNYWNEVNPYTINEKETYLDLTIYNSIQDVVQGITLESNLESIAINASNSFRQDVIIQTKVHSKPAPGLPFISSYDNGKLRNQQKLVSDVKGNTTVAVMNINTLNPHLQLELIPDMKALAPSGLDLILLQPILDGLEPKKSVYPIVVTMPTIAYFNQESNLGKVVEQSQLAAPLQQGLSKRGFQFTDRIDAADYVIYIEASTKEGGTSQGYHVAFLEMHVVVRNKNGDIVYRKSMQNIKGLQLNYEAAGIEAFKKVGKALEKDITNDISEAIL